MWTEWAKERERERKIYRDRMSETVQSTATNLNCQCLWSLPLNFICFRCELERERVRCTVERPYWDWIGYFLFEILIMCPNKAIRRPGIRPSDFPTQSNYNSNIINGVCLTHKKKLVAKCWMAIWRGQSKRIESYGRWFCYCFCSKNVCSN